MIARNFPRFTYSHRLSLSHENNFDRGEILDWSAKGIRFMSKIPLTQKSTYKARLHVHHDRGLKTPEELWNREGEIKWARFQDGTWHVGVELDQPIEDLKAQFDKIDYCYLYVQ